MRMNAYASPALEASRIPDPHDLSNMLQQQKRAYQESLDMEIQHQQRNFHLRSPTDTTRIAALVNLKKNEDRQHKIKTEQLYMLDNLELMRDNLRKSKKQEHPINDPFLRLVDSQDQRKQEVRKHFVYLNSLNQMQAQMKRQQHDHKRKTDRQDRLRFQDYVEGVFKQKDFERESFEKRYLHPKRNIVLGRPNEYSLNLLEPKGSQTCATSANLGMIPLNYDRYCQLEVLDHSMKGGMRKAQELTIGKAKELTIGKAKQSSMQIHREYELQVPTSRPLRQNMKEDRVEAKSQQARDQSAPRESGQSERMPVRKAERREFNHYDFILGRDKQYII